MTNVLVTAAEKLGRRHGSVRGEWLIDANISKEGAKKIIDGHDRGDPEIMDLCPNPLSGEYEDDPSEVLILEEIADLAAAEESDEVVPVEDDNLLDIYEVHFAEGFWETVLQAARNI